MSGLEIRPFNNPNNTDILNAIRKNASTDYQRRVPNADKSSITDSVNSLLNWTPAMNEFIFNLVNLVGLQIFKNNTWTNPLAKFKRGMLANGDTIEEVMNGLLTPHRYNEEAQYLEADIFGSEAPPAQVNFHKINRKDYYKLSVNSAILKRAFNNPQGLSDFITNLMSTPNTSDNWDEFLVTTSLFKTFHDAGGFFNVAVDDVSNLTSSSAQSQSMLRQMRAMGDTLPFLSTKYNPSGLPVSANREDLELFITPTANAALDVNALAGAFNIDSAKFDSRKTVIPAEYFGFDGVQAILTTREFFVIADTVMETQSAINPVGLNTNFFLHHHQIASVSRFVPAILFTSSEPATPIVIANTPVQSIATPTLVDANSLAATVLTRGSMYQVNAALSTAPTGGDNSAVILSISGALSSRTKIWQNSMIAIAVDEASTSIVITAKSADNPSISSSATFVVVGDKAVLWPNPQVDKDGATVDATFEATPTVITLNSKNKFTIPQQDGLTWNETIATGIAFTDTGDLVTIPSHGLVVGNQVKFGTITGTTGITAGTLYYVLSVVDANTVTLSATVGGALLALTTNGTAASAIIPLANGTIRTVATAQVVTVAATATAGWIIASGAPASFILTGV